MRRWQEVLTRYQTLRALGIVSPPQVSVVQCANDDSAPTGIPMAVPKTTRIQVQTMKDTMDRILALSMPRVTSVHPIELLTILDES